MKFKEHVALSKFSNYKIGGPARFFFAAKSEKEIKWALKEAREKKLPLFILGGGTNLLISDEGFDGLVLKPELVFLRSKGNLITVGAGISITELLHYSVAHSLSGFEWAGGLPGTVGGAIRGNAGAFGGEIKDNMVSVRSMDVKTGKIVERKAAACRFGYRMSIFRKQNGKEVILSATFRMKKGNKKEIAAAIKEKIDHRKKHQPLEYPNIGSIFKNVPLADLYPKQSTEHKHALQNRSLQFRGSSFSVKTDPFPVVAAAKFISEAGLRGVSSGGAMISPKHTNFIVNTLGAESSHVENLIGLAKAEVRGKFGVNLEEEIERV